MVAFYRTEDDRDVFASRFLSNGARQGCAFVSPFIEQSVTGMLLCGRIFYNQTGQGYGLWSVVSIS